MKCCTAKRCYAVVNFSFVMFWANVYCLYVLFLRNNPVKSVRRYNSNMHLHYWAVNSWLTIPTFPQSEIIYAKTKRSAFWASPTGDAQNARDMGMEMPKTRGCPVTVTPPSTQGFLVPGLLTPTSIFGMNQRDARRLAVRGENCLFWPLS